MAREIAVLVAANARADAAVERILAAARELDAADRDGAAELLRAAGVVGRCGQAREGQLVQLLAQADRVKAARGGVKAWVATQLDATDGRARGIALAARKIGAVPELAAPLSSGRIGMDTISVLSRTAKAVAGTGRDTAAALTATLETAQTGGITAAKKQVRLLEHTLDPGSSGELVARQRARSFLRVVELGDGLCRFEMLLDVVRATVLRSAIDVQAADWIRRAQFDGAHPLPADIRSVEQINAQAIVRLAEIFHTAPAELRGAAFSPTMLFTTPLNTDGLAQTVYGQLVSCAGLPQPGDAGTHLLEHDEAGEPVRLDGEDIDADPTARLASRRQRIALEFRDRHCSFPGCSRPPTWSLHAHHRTPVSRGGMTTVRNLSLLCPEHHTLTHQQPSAAHTSR